MSALKYWDGTAWQTVAGGFTMPFASLQVTNATPAATSSLTAVMMGLGASPSLARITPTATGKIFVIVSGVLQHNTLAGRANFDLRYGTVAGGVPANGVAATGTVFGSTGTFMAYAANVIGNFSINGFLTGLTLGTPYWLDSSFNTFAAGTVTPALIAVSAYELP